ncbi:MAG TPA: hypothetical protein VEL74_18455 [Thermoanaerobaculia bacterium]|nr:hypothetical protein [Thermoanaerobaculia bacterium]
MDKTRMVIAGTALAAALLLSPSPGRAQEESRVALGAKAGTLGAGVELTVGLGRQVNTRLGFGAYSYSERREASDIEYDGEAKLRNGTAFLDWHPGGRGFRLTGGLVYNDTEIQGESLTPASGVYNIGGVPVPASLVGRLEGTIDFDPIVPYAGLGWGNAVRGGGPWGFSLDLGVVFQGEGDVTLTPLIPANSPLNDPLARELLAIQLEREAQDIEEDIADYDLYPVLSLGVTYRF